MGIGQVEIQGQIRRLRQPHNPVWSRWWIRPICGGGMNRVNQYLFYEFGVALSALKSFSGGEDLINFALEFWSSQGAITKFIVETKDMPLVLSRQAARNLRDLLAKTLDETKKPNDEGKHELDFEATLPKSKVDEIQRKLLEFETVFSMEAQNLDIYSVTQKAGYKTDTLVQRGEEVIPKEIRAYMAEYAQKELHEAGRCLAFNLPTAAGFHMMRSLESSLHDYWDVVSGGKTRPTLPNGNDAPMGVYITDVEKEKADAKVVGVLRQIKDLHRNPLMHPDAVLSMTEAMVLLGVVSSALMAMVEDMKKKGATPVAPSSPPSAAAS